MEQQLGSTTRSKPYWLIIVIVAAIAVSIFVFSTRKTAESATSLKTTSPSSNDVTPDSSIIKVEGGMFYFKPNEIRVKKGQLVKIEFTNKEGMHDFVLDEFNVKTNVIQAGKSETVEFTPNRVGEFEFYCSVPSHKQQGMVGKLIVEE